MDKAIALLLHYGFDLSGYTTDDLYRAFSKYDANWVQSAVVECIFQGRYKAVSVLQLLVAWAKRGAMKCHFTKEFERLICQDIPVPEPVNLAPVSSSTTPAQPTLYRHAIGSFDLSPSDSPFLHRLIHMCADE